MTREVLVYADWEAFTEPVLVGVLRQSMVRNREHFSFRYEDNWLRSEHVRAIDPELELFQGEQQSSGEDNFRTFLDSCPDRWGRTLMQRREAILARQEERTRRRLTEVDYLLGVHDTFRMGALRFKEGSNGPFLNNLDELAAPPLTSLRELEQAAWRIQQPDSDDDPDIARWLGMLISPGSSLGGARPKASVVVGEDQLWLAKFPGRDDQHDIAAWEYVTYLLALEAGIVMAPSELQVFASPHRTFLTKRFDRSPDSRIHFSSAMTQLGYYDGRADGASYLEIAEFLTRSGGNVPEDLPQLWRRILFSVAVSNTDDHLRNHGFLLTPAGWVLSPAYDINPNPDGPAGLTLNIDEVDNSLNLDLVMSVAPMFQLRHSKAIGIRDEVLAAVSNWRRKAEQLGLSSIEIDRMALAFQPSQHC
jgi:serine/threonine-protein kinase HipA